MLLLTNGLAGAGCATGSQAQLTGGGEGGGATGVGGGATVSTSTNATTTSGGQGGYGSSSQSSSSQSSSSQSSSSQSGAGGGGGQGGACDAGCTPLGITFTGLEYTQQYGNPNGGQVYEDSCPTGQVVIGYQGFLHPNGYHGKIQAQCGVPTIQGSGPYSISIAAGALTPLEGGQSNGNLWTMECPASQVVVGFSGRSGGLLDFLSPDCAPLLITGSPGDYSVTIGAVTSLPGIGDPGGNTFADTRCPAGEVATENHLRCGDGVDAFGIGCSTPALTY